MRIEVFIVWKCP